MKYRPYSALELHVTCHNVKMMTVAAVAYIYLAREFLGENSLWRCIYVFLFSYLAELMFETLTS